MNTMLQKKPPTPKVIIGQEPPIPAWFLHSKTTISPGQHLQAALSQWLWFLSTWDRYTSTRQMTTSILIKLGRADILILQNSSLPTKKKCSPTQGWDEHRYKSKYSAPKDQHVHRQSPTPELLEPQSLKKTNHSLNGDFNFQFRLDFWWDKKLPPHLFMQPAPSSLLRRNLSGESGHRNRAWEHSHH